MKYEMEPVLKDLNTDDDSLCNESMLDLDIDY